MNHMEDGIYSAHDEMIELQILVQNLQTRVDTLEGNLINNMPNNIFYEDFSTLDDINLVDGVYDIKEKKIYY